MKYPADWRARRFLVMFAAVCCLLAQAASAKETPLPAAANLALEAAAAARQHMPLILIVSLPDCPYCEQVRRRHLVPMHKQGFIVRQVYINGESSVTGFDGKPLSQKQLALDYAVKAAPTVLFLDMQGRPLAAPIVGALLEDFYGAYLDEAIATAKQKLAQ
ncbi:thioredoxin fold domain-containing protein [Undibacterium sp.]|uniref:thioredoxin fold domain-containing protein n=1 Tax=Undibacterium sp. TaxID=1914977 RepID=UPI002C18C978|nr:thioredoxin fold domain-containing protein [Undibacterium sp.]HTD02563.1 thioredoxin fold domain-containing protein [Undibacterium sp.]